MAETELSKDEQELNDTFLNIFQASHNLYDKLILLNYLKEFCSLYKCRPIHRYYFATQTNPGEQFYIFSCFCAWLIKDICKLSIKGELNPQDYDDPTMTINSIFEGIQLIDNKLTFPVNKIKQGYGIEVITILSFLVDDGMKKLYKPSDSIVIKGILDKDENEMVEYFEEGDENELEISLDDDYTLINDELNEADYEENKVSQDHIKYKNILWSQVDKSEWQLEVEKILPQLKVVLKPSDHKADWRLHMTELKNTREKMEETFNSTRVLLERLSTELTNAMNKIVSRENFLQHQLEVLINEYVSLKSHLKQITDNYKLVSGGLTEKSKQLASISEECDTIKEEMEERGTMMSDGSPLINLKKSFLKIKSDIASIDIRIGVAVHTLIQVKFLEGTKNNLQKQKPAFKSWKSNLQELDF